MKKNFIPAMLFIVAVTISSCSEDIPKEGVIQSASDLELVKINTSSGTTRGEDVTTNTLEDSDGVKLHIVHNESSTHDTYDFICNSSDWSHNVENEEDAVTWADVTLPAYFYSMHDGTSQKLVTTTASSSLDYSVEGSSSAHKDLVYHASLLSAIPTGGTINVFHKHALSKIHLYAATGGNKLYVGRVRLVNVYGDGTVKIEPVDASDLTSTEGVTWSDLATNTSYKYYSVGDDDDDDSTSAEMIQTTDDNGDPIINDDGAAPFMIIPQTTVGATVADITAKGIETTGTYIEVIYYMTDSNDYPIVGYSSVEARDDANYYSDEDQEKVLYVMGAFPVSYTFVENLEYDITLGLGSDGSSGGILLADYYVDEDGNAVTLTLLDTDGDGEDEEIDELEIPEIEQGDDILATSDDAIDIIVTSGNWSYESDDDTE